MTFLFNQTLAKRANLYSMTNAMRLINGAGDQFPGITLDQYDRHFVIQLFSPQTNKFLSRLKDFVVARFNPDYLIVKDRSINDRVHLDRPKVDVVINKKGSKTIVIENGLKFEVDLNDTINVGLFLDMRKGRAVIGALAKGKKVLNCFAYTSSFGVYARHFGADNVINVDISRKNLEKGKKNYELNVLSPGPQEFIKEDCMRFLIQSLRKNRTWDLIILDPPSFARYGSKTFSVKKDLKQLIKSSIQVLNPGECLFVSSNLSTISPQVLKDLVNRSVLDLGLRLTRAHFYGQGIDFPVGGTMPESSLVAMLTSLK